VGIKVASPGNAAVADLSFFYVDWRDIQVDVLVNNNSYTANEAAASSRGFELSTSYIPVGGLQLAYNVAFTRAEVNRTSPAANFMLTGYQLSDVPKWSMSGSAGYSWSLTRLWSAQLGGTVSWIGERWKSVQSYSLGGDPSVTMPSYAVTGINGHLFRGPLTLRFFARNLANKRAYPNRLAVLDVSSAPVQVVDKVLQPRTLGIGIGYAF
jgi:hypothetical protein